MALSATPASGPPLSKRLRDGLLSHVGLLLIVMFGMLGAGLYLTNRVISALPDVGKSLPIANTWGAPIAVERESNGWLVAHVPLCAQRPVAGLFLWDDHNRPLWQLSGQAFPISDFLVGQVPPGLKVVHKFQQPSRNQLLRLGVFRASGQPAGVTFRIRDLRAGKVRYGGKWMTADQFKVSTKCPKPAAAKRSTSTSAPNTLPARTAPAATEPTPTYPTTTGAP